MTEQQTPAKPALDEVMLAMDVVDTLRHNERLVERELSTEDRDARLKERLRRIYTAQGLEVSDWALEEGVAALKEERFKYEPPPPSFAVRLANLYVDRGRWGKAALIAVAALVLVLAAAQGYRFYQTQQRQALASEITASWQSFERANPEPALQAVGAAIYRRAQTALDRNDAKAARSQLALLNELQQLQAARDAVLESARDPRARTQAEQYFDAGLAALQAGDGQRVQGFLERLQNLHRQLEQEYVVRIVSRPGVPSGIWREPAGNPGARNYYLIVEALSPTGKPVEVAITSEEDGSTQKVSQWGLRVDERTFAQVRADKQDDGIIQNAQVAVKRRGLLEPHYSMPVAGGAITNW